jgi:hypothetical protein
MCDCGCNTCDKTMMINENLAPKEILSEGLKYHVDNNRPLTEHLYRAGSQNYFNLWAEARSLYSRQILEITNEDDLEILTETDLGHFGTIYEIEIGDKVKASKEYGGLSGEVVDVKGSFVVVKTKKGTKSYHESDLQVLNKEGIKVPLDFPMLDEEVNSRDLNNAVYRLKNVYKYLDIEYKETRRGEKYVQINYIPVTSPQSQNPEFVNVRYNNDEDLEIIKNRLDFPIELTEGEINEEAKKKKKDPPIGKPMRDTSGGKAYKVYVRDPKTKNIKTVRFGSGGLRAKINDSKARAAFAKRHKCSTKKDRTKASYWSCRLPRYAKLLGLKSSFSGFW